MSSMNLAEMDGLVSDAERVAEEFRRHCGKDVFYRLSMDHGASDLDSSKPDHLSEVVTHCSNYLARAVVTDVLLSVVTSLERPSTAVALQRLSKRPVVLPHFQVDD